MTISTRRLRHVGCVTDPLSLLNCAMNFQECIMLAEKIDLNATLFVIGPRGKDEYPWHEVKNVKDYQRGRVYNDEL